MKGYKTHLRYGCDHCKKDKVTFLYEHVKNPEIWLCQQCVDLLLEWTRTQINNRKVMD